MAYLAFGMVCIGLGFNYTFRNMSTNRKIVISHGDFKKAHQQITDLSKENSIDLIDIQIIGTGFDSITFGSELASAIKNSPHKTKVYVDRYPNNSLKQICLAANEYSYNVDNLIFCISCAKKDNLMTGKPELKMIYRVRDENSLQIINESETPCYGKVEEYDSSEKSIELALSNDIMVQRIFERNDDMWNQRDEW
jgi:hypothetical protein